MHTDPNIDTGLEHARQQSLALQKLIGDEGRIVAQFLIRLTEFNRARMYERLGYASLWDFCTRGLGLCESTAGRRIAAARVIEQFPSVVDYLNDGRLCATRMLLLSKTLSPENAASLFDQASRKSMKEIELLVATANPQPAPPARIQKLPEPRAQSAPAPVLAFDLPTQTTPPAQCAAPEAPIPQPTRRSEIHPTSAQEYSVRLPVSRGWVEKLEIAKKLGSHVVPTGDPAAILELALDLFIEKHGKRRGAIAVKPRPPKARATKPSAPRTETQTPKRKPINAETRRQVWMRDGGRCAWKMDSGERCDSEWQVELDHVTAVANGGSSDPASIRLLCRRHNDQHARETFGEEFMAAKKTGASPSPRVVATGVATSSGGKLFS